MDLNEFLTDEGRRRFIRSGLRSLLAGGSLLLSGFLVFRDTRVNKTGPSFQALSCRDCCRRGQCDLTLKKADPSGCYQPPGETDGGK